VGRAEVPRVRPVGPGEGAAPVAEELAFGQALGQGGAVEAEVAALAAALGVYGAGDHLLPGARLSLEDDGQIALGDLQGG
jgi:hypothetical protein